MPGPIIVAPIRGLFDRPSSRVGHARLLPATVGRRESRCGGSPRRRGRRSGTNRTQPPLGREAGDAARSPAARRRRSASLFTSLRDARRMIRMPGENSAQ